MHQGPELSVIVVIGVALALGALARVVAPRLRIPYTVAMLLLGVGCGSILGSSWGEHAGLLHLVASGKDVGPDLIIFIFLPALVFESAFSIHTHAFIRNLGAIALLAVPALLIATGLTAMLMIGLTGPSWQWGWTAALAFGALISATDPVAVVALLKELGAPKRLGLLIEGESLLNDGTAIVVFLVLLGMLTGHAEFEAHAALLDFAWKVCGGIGVGLLLGWAICSWIGRIFNDPMVEITLTIVLAYAVMIVGEAVMHASGVIAIVTAGLYISGPGRSRISPPVEHFLHRFWEMLAYLANTLIFFLVGLIVSSQLSAIDGTSILIAGTAFIGILIIRFGLIFSFRPIIGKVAAPVTAAESAAMAWGGLRGAVSLALALTVSQHHEIPEALRQQILFVTTAVVVATILINGSTMATVLRKLGLHRPPPGQRLAEVAVRASALEHVERAVHRMHTKGALPTVNWSNLEEELKERRTRLENELKELREEIRASDPKARARGYWAQLLTIERQAYWSAFGEGTLSARAVRHLDHAVDQKLDRLARGDLLTDPELKLGLINIFGDRTTERIALRYDLLRGIAWAGKQALMQLQQFDEIDDDVRSDLEAYYGKQRRHAKAELEDLRANLPELTRAIETRIAQRIGLNLEHEKFEELGETGALPPTAIEHEMASINRRMKALDRRIGNASLPETADLCRQSPLFRSLEEEALEDLAEITIERVYGSGDELFHEGDSASSMFIIARGAIEVIQGPESSEILLDVLGGGDVLGEMALLGSAPRNATARAATTTTVGEISRSEFDRFMDARPRVRDGIWTAFVRRRLDNFLPFRPEWRHLNHDQRMRWMDNAQVVALEPEERLDSSRGDWIFVAEGMLSSLGHRHEAPALVEGGHAYSAATASHVAVLPPKQPKQVEHGLTIQS